MKYSWKVSAELATHTGCSLGHGASRAGPLLARSPWGLWAAESLLAWGFCAAAQPFAQPAKAFQKQSGTPRRFCPRQAGGVDCFCLFFFFLFFSQAQAQMATEAAECEPNTEAFVKATLKPPWSGQLEIFLNFFIGTSAL